MEKIKPYEISCPVVFDVERVSGEPGRMNDISVEERTEFTRLILQLAFHLFLVKGIIEKPERHGGKFLSGR